MACRFCAEGQHCGWESCCPSPRSNPSPMGQGQVRKSDRRGCLMVLPRPVVLLVEMIGRRTPAYRAARLNRYAEL